MLATGSPRNSLRRPVGRLGLVLLGAGFVLLAAVFVAAGWRFVSPPDTVSALTAVRLAPASDFALGSVTGYRITSEGAVERAPDPSVYRAALSAPGSRLTSTGIFYVVRLPDGDFRVLSGRSTHLGGLVVWDASGTPWSNSQYVGVFIEPAHSEQWTIDGTGFYGPAPRDLDRYEWHLDQDGVLVIDLSEALRGELRTGRQSPQTLPPPYDVTAEGWGASGWPSVSD